MKWLIRVPAVLAILVVMNGLPWSGLAEEIRWGRRPAQFYSPLAAEIQLNGANVLGIAHNAGDGAVSSSLAVAHGADMIEIDVVVFDGRLYAAHVSPPGWLPARVYRGPTLHDAWIQTAGARFVELDLKDSSPATLRLVLAFLKGHADGRRVFVSTRSISALQTFSDQAPDVVRLLSIGDRHGLETLFDNPDRAKVLNGVSVRASLLDDETTGWFKERGLLVLAWTVNDVAQLNNLVGHGIDAVATDNLAILDALSQAELRRDAANLGRLIP